MPVCNAVQQEKPLLGAQITYTPLEVTGSCTAAPLGACLHGYMQYVCYQQPRHPCNMVMAAMLFVAGA